MGLIDKISAIFGGKKEEIKHESALSKVKILEEKSSEIEKTMHINVEVPKQQYIVKIDGEYSIFDSKEDMPEGLLHDVEEIEHANGTSSSYTVIVDGKRQTFSSLDEIPEEIRGQIRDNPQA